MRKVFYTIFAAFYLGCAAPQDLELVPAPDPTWAEKDRHCFYNERLQVKFKTGNIRFGTLRMTRNERTIFINNSDDQGIYQLREIDWIKHNREIIYP